MKINVTLLAAFTAVTFFSCKKDNADKPSNALVGNWKFISETVDTHVEQSYTDGGVQHKTITTSSYTSTDNTGDVVIDANKMTGTGMGFKLTINAFATSYVDDQIVDTFSLPFNYTIPPSNFSNTYKLIGADSIIVEGSSLVDIPGTAETVQGGRLVFEGNTFSIVSHVDKTTVSADLGVTVTKHEYATASTTFERK